MSEEKSEDECEDEADQEYDLQEAAALLNKSEAAVRMQIRRESIKAVKRPIDESGRYKYFIKKGEIEKERKRLRTSTRRGEDREPTALSEQFERERHSAPVVPGEVNALRDRIERIEREQQEEREDTRALIRALEKQVDLIRMMLSSLMDR